MRKGINLILILTGTVLGPVRHNVLSQLSGGRLH
jgi:hypothetical protein